MSIDQIIAFAQVLATVGGAAGAVITLRKRQDATDRRLDATDAHQAAQDGRLDGHDTAILDLASGTRAPSR